MITPLSSASGNTSLSNIDKNVQDDDQLDIFATSLGSIFSETPVTFADPSHSFTKRGISVYPPSTIAANWRLQTDAIWRSAIHLADHLPDVTNKDVLELGAGSGLPGILAAKEGSPRSLVLSDYPDPIIIATLQANLQRNASHLTAGCSRVAVIEHAWGTPEIAWPFGLEAFDVIMGADILWMSEQHENLLGTLSNSLRRNKDARIHLVAGLHTGRWPIERFINEAISKGFVIGRLVEISVIDETQCRPWQAEREEEETERRKWLVEMTLGWSDSRVC
jgi:EEF1A N-terminal glycine/lysine methyltransferase